MHGLPAVYCGRLVEKDTFRVFIYNANLEKKLIESWDVFVAHMETGLWFSTSKAAREAKKCAEELQNEDEIVQLKKPTKAK